MKPINYTYMLLLATLSFLSCKRNNKNQYAIKDFRILLQPKLTKIVTEGVVFGFDSTMRYDATDAELYQLSRSEHPVLRAVALKEILQRPAIDHFDIIMNHLDDTALISIDVGEWGYRYTTVSDDMISDAKWKTKEDKLKTIDALITKHSYLKSAYRALAKIETQEKYYSYIKEMAQRERPFGEIEYALQALAEYKKPDDIALIKKILLVYNSSMGNRSFEFMQRYPNEDYMDVFEKYYPRSFYRIICKNNYSYEARSFIKAVASYKTERSAKILEAILNKKPFMPCPADTGFLKHGLIYAICENDCKVYAAMRKRVMPIYEEYEKQRKIFSYDSIINISLNTTSEKPVRWW